MSLWSRENILFAALAALLSIAVTGCKSKTVGGFSVVNRVAIERVEDTGHMDVTAKCLDGEEMLGGGYTVTAPHLGGTPSGEPVSPLIVEANYPSASNSWTVTVFNPDADTEGPNAGVLASAEAYCLKSPIYPVRIEKVSSEAVSVDFDKPTVIGASCPDRSVVTGGGFHTEHTVSHAGLYGAWLMESAPDVGADGQAIGWRVMQQAIAWPPPPSPPVTRAHVLCATQNLTAAAVVESEVLPTAPYNYWYYEGWAECARDEFSTGGGYQFVGDYLVPHQAYQTATLGDFGGWGIGAIYGHQTGGIGEVVARAACIELPPLALIVKITNPANVSYLPLATPTETVPITFSAIAVNTSGDPVDGVSFDWTVNGSLFGSGASFSASLPAASCGFLHHQITVTGTDVASNSASDAITLFAGRVC
jgi:hypothetical protein